jgi:lipocalin-like protein
MINGIPERRAQLMVDLVGAWRLTSAYFVAEGSGERLDALGDEPFGSMVFEPGGRMIGLATAGASTRAASATDMASLHRSMASYTGRWSVEGEKLVTQVDGAWEPSWVGTEQVRYLEWDGSTLSLRMAPVDHPAFPGEKVIGYLDWEKEA